MMGEKSLRWLLVFSLFLTFCLVPLSGVCAEERKEIRVGAINAITGVDAMIGVEQKWAYEQAVADEAAIAFGLGPARVIVNRVVVPGETAEELGFGLGEGSGIGEAVAFFQTLDSLPAHRIGHRNLLGLG